MSTKLSPETPRLQLLSIASDGSTTLIASLAEPGLDERLALVSLVGGDVAVASLSDAGLVVRRVTPAGTIVYRSIVPGAAWELNMPGVRPVLATDAVGNVYLATEGEGDLSTVAISPGGQLRWSKTFDPSDGGEDAPSSIVYREGRVTVAGVAANGLAIVQYDLDGNLLWQKNHDAPGNVDLANVAVLDRFGRVHVAGTTTLGSQSRDIVTVTWEPDGTKRQSSQWSGPGEHNDLASGIVNDGAGALTVAGEVGATGAVFLRYDVPTPDCNANGILDPLESACKDECDADTDACPDDLDCDAGNAGVWATPGPARRLRADRTGNAITLEWDPPESSGGATVLYDLLGSSSADEFAQATCLDSATPLSTASDTRPLDENEAVFYLVRAANGCPGAGSLGADSAGVPRTGADCSGVPR